MREGERKRGCDTARWRISWDRGDVIDVDAYVVRDGWDGAGRDDVGRITISTLIPETPWFFDLDEL